MQTLYRKYRSQDFDQVYGQDAITKVIQKQVVKDRLGHAYLFTGPRGTGKTTMARLLAKAVNCTKSKDGNPCVTCDSCSAIEKGKYLDLIEIDAASNRGIDEIRRLKERVGFSPTEGNYKVYIIDEVHMLTKDAFNALLKTLEEPPTHVIFILATTEPHKIPATILSRCQRFNFALATEDTILKKLEYICKQEKVKFEKDALRAIVKNSGGSFRDAESILDKVIGAVGVTKDNTVNIEDVTEILGLAEGAKIKEFIEALLAKDATKSLSVFSEVSESGVNLIQFIRQALEQCRELLLDKVAHEEGEFSLIDLLKVITELSNAESKMKFTTVVQLPIEVAIVSICTVGEQSAREVPAPAKPKKKKKIQKVIKSIPKKIKASISEENSSVEIEQISEQWGSIIEKTKPHNHHLSAFLKKARPLKMQGNKVVLQVPFRFHKQRIESHKAQEIFSQVLGQLVGEELSCVCEVTQEAVVEDIKSESASKDNNGVVLEVLGDMLE